MSREEVVSVVNDFLEEEFEIEVDTLEPDAVMHEALELDSLDYVDLVIVIESNFGFKITGEDFKTITTLLRDGKIRPVIDSVMPLSEGKQAYRRMEEGKQSGKIILTP